MVDLFNSIPAFGLRVMLPLRRFRTSRNSCVSRVRLIICHTPGMSLKVGHRHVDQSGLVYLPYLHEWAGMTHNLVELCAHMSSVFGAEPPVREGVATARNMFSSALQLCVTVLALLQRCSRCIIVWVQIGDFLRLVHSESK